MALAGWRRRRSLETKCAVALDRSRRLAARCGRRAAFRNWLDERFASVYRQAQSRLCVSPAMSRFYEERYGAPAQSIYPSRAADCPEFDEPPARLAQQRPAIHNRIRGHDQFKRLHPRIETLQDALKPVGGRLLIFGPMTQRRSQQFGLTDPNTEIRGLLSFDRIADDAARRSRRAICPDVIRRPRSRQHGNGVSQQARRLHRHRFAALIYGPAYCSAVTWARENAASPKSSKPNAISATPSTVLANNPDTSPRTRQTRARQPAANTSPTTAPNNISSALYPCNPWLSLS